MLATLKIELIVTAIGQPAIHQVAVEPRAPATLQRHTRPNLPQHEKDADGKQGKINEGQEKNRSGLVSLERIEKLSAPDINAVERSQIAQDYEKAERR
jgi:hypothetical protein